MHSTAGIFTVTCIILERWSMKFSTRKMDDCTGTIKTDSSPDGNTSRALKLKGKTMQALLVKLVKFALLTLALVALAITASAAEPTAEQLEIMKQYGLSVPPVILDKDGHDKALIKKETPKINDAFDEHVATKKEVEVHATENGKQIDVVFSPIGEVVELPPVVKKIVRAEIIQNPDTKNLFDTFIGPVTDDTFESRVENSQGAVLVDFYADWCTPCREMAPDIEALSHEFSGIKFVKVDYDHAKISSAKYGVTRLARMLIFVDGKVIASKEGRTSKEDIKNWIVSSVPQCGYRGPQSVPAVERVVVDKSEYQPEYRQERPAVRMFAGRGVRE